MSVVRKYPRETVELVPVNVRLDGVVVTTGVELSVALGTARPGSTSHAWAAATVVSDQTFYLLTGLAPGRWTVYARVAASPEIPVIECGQIWIT